MYVWCLNTMHGFKGGGREKETLEMPLGVLAEQFSIRIAESRLVAGNFPWLMTASSFSLLWEGFCLYVCFWGCVWAGFLAFVFAACLAFFCLPCHITILGELAPTDCVGDPGSSASSGQLKDLYSVFSLS